MHGSVSKGYYLVTFIANSTIEENSTFGTSYDAERYQQGWLWNLVSVWKRGPSFQKEFSRRGK